MKKFFFQILFLFCVLSVVISGLSCSNLPGTNNESSSSGKLYFCEDYVNSTEINKSDTFTTGKLTVMVRTNQEISDKDVTLKIEKINFIGSSDKINTLKFTIPVGDYFYFKHKDLAFSQPGKYRVTLLGKDDNPICWGEVTITP